jgi:hypothetical protein
VGIAGAIGGVCTLTLAYGLSFFAALLSPWVIVPAVVAIASLLAYLFSIRNSKSVPTNVPIVNPMQRSENYYNWAVETPASSDAQALAGKLDGQKFNWDEKVTPGEFVKFVRKEIATIPPDEKSHLLLEVAKLVSQNQRDACRHSAVAMLTFLADGLTIQSIDDETRMTRKGELSARVRKESGDEEQRVLKKIILSGAKGLDVMYSHACGELSKYLQSIDFQAKVVGSIPAMWIDTPVVSMEKIDGVEVESLFSTGITIEEYNSFIDNRSEGVKNREDFFIKEQCIIGRGKNYIACWKGHGSEFENYDHYCICRNGTIQDLSSLEKNIEGGSFGFVNWRAIFRPFLADDSLHYCIVGEDVGKIFKQHFPFFPSEKGGELLSQLIWAEIMGQIIAHGDLETSSNIMFGGDNQSVLIGTDKKMKMDSPEIDSSRFPILDEAMAKAIEGIDVGRVGEILDKRLMPANVRNAMGRRIAKLKKMVTQMRAAEKIIGVDDWKSQQIEIAMQTRFKDCLRGRRISFHRLKFLAGNRHAPYLQPDHQAFKDIRLLGQGAKDTEAEIYLQKVVSLI